MLGKGPGYWDLFGPGVWEMAHIELKALSDDKRCPPGLRIAHDRSRGRVVTDVFGYYLMLNTGRVLPWHIVQDRARHP